MENLKSNMFLIFGLFFMERTNGPGVYAKNFSGTISFESGQPIGVLEDYYGSSIIVASRLFSEKEFFFSKEYEDKGKFTFFFFKDEKKELWQGYWRDETTTQSLGLAQCVLVPYPENFMDPIETIKFLKSRGMEDYEIPLIKCFSIENILSKM